MDLDEKIESVLKSLNTEVKMIVQLLLDPSRDSVKGLSASRLSDIMSDYAGDQWSLDKGSVIKVCKRLSDLGALSRLINEKRTGERPAKYYFVTNNGIGLAYRPLAALALRTAVDNEVSFYDVFSCFGGTRKLDNGNSNLASRGLVYAFRTLLSFYDRDAIISDAYSPSDVTPLEQHYPSLVELLGTTDATTRRIVERLKEAGLVRVEEKEAVCRYSLTDKSLIERKGRGSTVTLVPMISSIINSEFEDSDFTERDLVESMREQGTSPKRKHLSYLLTCLTNEGYLTRTPLKEPYGLFLTQLGENFVKQFIIPMYRLLMGLETKEGVYNLAGFRSYLEMPKDLIKSALRIYSLAEKHIKSS